MLVSSLLNATAEVWVIIPASVRYCIRKFLHFLQALHQTLDASDISNPHEYARVLLNLVAYNFLLKLYI